MTNRRRLSLFICANGASTKRMYVGANGASAKRAGNDND
jgi:hypothetical protein